MEKVTMKLEDLQWVISRLEEITDPKVSINLDPGEMYKSAYLQMKSDIEALAFAFDSTIQYQINKEDQNG